MVLHSEKELLVAFTDDEERCPIGGLAPLSMRLSMDWRKASARPSRGFSFSAAKVPVVSLTAADDSTFQFQLYSLPDCSRYGRKQLSPDRLAGPLAFPSAGRLRRFRYRPYLLSCMRNHRARRNSGLLETPGLGSL
jgi:hypothetical protein